MKTAIWYVLNVGITTAHRNDTLNESGNIGTERMKAVNQSVVSDKNGNCHAACLACLLELPMESMPDFFVDTPPNAYQRRTDWLQERGFQEAYFLVGSFPPPHGWAILSVKSATFPGSLHSVVWDGERTGWGKIVHNPNPQDPRGIEIPNEDWVGFWVLAPLDPKTSIQYMKG